MPLAPVTGMGTLAARVVRYDSMAFPASTTASVGPSAVALKSALKSGTITSSRDTCPAASGPSCVQINPSARVRFTLKQQPRRSSVGRPSRVSRAIHAAAGVQPLPCSASACPGAYHGKASGLPSGFSSPWCRLPGRRTSRVDHVAGCGHSVSDTCRLIGRRSPRVFKRAGAVFYEDCFWRLSKITSMFRFAVSRLSARAFEFFLRTEKNSSRASHKIQIDFTIEFAL
jgi:hypothetical protein